MSEILILTSVLVPLLAAALSKAWPTLWLMVCAPLPAIASAAVITSETVAIPWVLLGIELGITPLNHPFLLVSALVWLAAAIYCLRFPEPSTNSLSSRVFALLAMAGNFLLILSQDAISFYVGFTLMGLTTYAMVRANLSKQAKRAALYYLVMTLVAEMALFFGVVSAVKDGGSHYFAQWDRAQITTLSSALLLIAVAIKGALWGFHGWLIAAHSSAPYPASAVMSGLMVKAGILILIKFFPLGEIPIAWAGYTLMVLGAIGSQLALLAALRQGHPKVLLAYSTVSKVGILFCGFGLILLDRSLAPALLPALILYACAHSLIKSALFLNLGVAHHKQLPWLLSIFPLLLFAGIPFSAADATKAAFIEAITGSSYYSIVYLLLLSSGVLTVLVMFKLYKLQMLNTQPTPTAGPMDWSSPLILVIASLLLPHWVATEFKLSAYLPLLLGGLVLLILRHKLARVSFPLTDKPIILVGVIKLIRRLGRLFNNRLTPLSIRLPDWKLSLLNTSSSVYPSIGSLGVLLLIFFIFGGP